MFDKDDAYKVTGRFVKVVSPRDEADLDQPDPVPVLAEIKTRLRGRADIFSFCQRPPDITPRYSFHQEWDRIALLEYQSHKHWQERILDDKTRNMIRKGPKKGVEIRLAEFDEFLINGIQEIYNESPVRQGRPFKHFGKSFQEVREANATHLDRSVFIAAIYEKELIGFIKLVFGDRTARAEQIISKMKHRDKSPMNALIDRAVILCEQRGIPFLVYGIWPRKGSFAKFKANSGFKEYCLPRYFVSLNFIGSISIKLGFHREIKERLPEFMRGPLVALREHRYRKKGRAS